VITILVGGSIEVFPYLFTEKEGKVSLTLPQLTVYRGIYQVVLVLKARQLIYTGHATSKKFTYKGKPKLE
jgi:hypothetical protein